MACLYLPRQVFLEFPLVALGTTNARQNNEHDLWKALVHSRGTYHSRYAIADLQWQCVRGFVINGGAGQS